MNGLPMFSRPFGLRPLRMLRALSRWFCFVILLAWGALACANDHIRSIAFFEDASKSLSFEQLPQTSFQPFSGVLSLGYTPSAIWIRLHIDPEGASDALILRIRPSFLDQVSLYDPTFGSMGQEVRGDEQSHQDRYQSLNLNFTIPAGQNPRDIWLKVETASTLLFMVDVLNFADALHADMAQQLKYDIYLAFVGYLVIWGFWNWWSTRDRVLALFVFKELLCFVYMVGYLGYAQNIWPNSWPIYSGFLADIALGPYVASAYLFDYQFLSEYRLNRFLLGALRVPPLLLPIYLMLLLTGFQQEAFALNMVLTALGPVLSFLAALSIRPSPRNEGAYLLPRRVLIAVYGVILMGLYLSSLPAVGLLSAGALVFDGFLLYSICSGAAFWVVLKIRARLGEQKRLMLEVQYDQVRQRFDEERDRRKQQEQFLAMLTHELRTPLSVVRMALGIVDHGQGEIVEAERSIEEMSSILDRCLTTDRIEGGQVAPHPDRFNSAEAIQDLVQRCSEPSKVQISVEGQSMINTDHVLFRLIVANLVDNALKYGEKDSDVSVRIKTNSTELHVVVENLPGKTGWPDPQRLFQKYYRSSSAQRISGTGLGLYLSHQISARLGGELTYTPSTNHIGFTLCLPL